ncbi:caprin-2 isoform X3 [Erinaceus europaeus]|uniref:Caprin-2 isoform X3 n=1 Tax=Erinaceus europaeus TaxID=9365 RepID=A0A1S3WV57_ERIEU|nr:caprin-2 isoform X3 [Erinaceus europaeus]
MVQLSPSPLSSQGGWEGSMKPAKPPGNRRALSPPHPPLPSSASLSHTYETYVDNGLICLKHKIRNIEKKKLKLEDYKDRLKNGEQLNPDQLEAVEKYEEVLHNLEFAKELQKTFSGLSQDLLKAQRKAQRREHLLKLEAERKKLCTLLQVQYVLQSLAQEQVRADLREGLHGALCLPLQELDYLIQFSKLTCLERNESLSVEDQMEQSSLYFWDLLEGSEKAVVGTTYKHMKDLLSKLLHSGYFETIHIAKNSKEKEVSLEEEELIKPEPENQLLEIETVRESESLMEFSQAEIQPQEFLNRRYLAGVDYSLEQGQPSWEPGYAGRPSLSQCWEEACAEADDQEKREAWESPGKCQQLSKPDAPLDGRKRQVPALRSSLALPVERGTQAVSRPKLPPSQWEPDRPVGKVGGLPEDQEQHEAPQQPWPGQLQKEQEQELGTPAAKALGTWEKDASAEQKHPYLPSSQLAPKSWGSAPASLLPRKLATAEPKNDSDLDLDKPASVIPASQLPPASPSSPEASSEQSLASQSDFLQESLQAMSSPITCSPSTCLDATQQVTSGSDMESSEAVGAPSKSPSANPPSCQGSEQAFQSPPGNGSMTVSSMPFQAMQTVLHGKAPLPPRKEQEAKESLYSADCSHGFSTTSTQTLPQCLLPTIHLEPAMLPQDVASYPDVMAPGSSGSLAFYPAPAGVFPRPSPPFMASRAPVRGCSRGGRLLAGSYRSPGGFKGFDPYRGHASVPNGSYSQLQFQTREFTGAPYSPRDNFQPCYKRGGVPGGPRTSSRAAVATGWSDSSQVSSPERDAEAFTSGDSGHGDSRSLTPVDTAGTLLPLHVYSLPPQMRVAFSAARTSNLTPGTLDQPIVFDLLINNLGETFDLQLGRFACPVNGTYVFIFHMLKLAVNVPLYVNLMRNEEVLVSAYANDGAPDHETASNHAVLQLCRGDQIWLRLHRGAIYGSSWKYSTFSGYLLYQD